MQSHELWVQAEAAVQAQLDLDVLEEAAGLAEAEVSDLTLAGLLADSIGLMVSVRVGSSIVRGELTAASHLDPWILISRHTLIRRSAVCHVSGLMRVCAGASENPSRVGLRVVSTSWLRDQIGQRIQFTMGGVVLVAEMVDLGSDFMTVMVNGTYEVVALGNVDLMKVFASA